MTIAPVFVVDAQVLTVTRAARLALEQISAEHPRAGWRRPVKPEPCFWEPDMAGACSIAALALARLLRRRGIAAVFVIGGFDGSGPGSHCWVEVETLRLDITATQFKQPAVYITRVGEDGDRYEHEMRGLAAHRDAANWLWPSNTQRRWVDRICRRAERLLRPGV